MIVVFCFSFIDLLLFSDDTGKNIILRGISRTENKGKLQRKWPLVSVMGSALASPVD